MIRYLELRNWRAFDKVTLHLDEGTTFVVAENGIGKTSLLRGAAWTLFAPRHIDPKIEVRSATGTEETVGAVTLTTSEGDLEIERSYRPGGRPAHRVEATLDGLALDPHDLDQRLGALLSARPDIACELGFVHQHALATDKNLFSNVGELLRRLTGVEHLQAVRSALAKAQRRHEAAAREFARQTATDVAARDDLAGQITAAAGTVEAIAVDEQAARQHLIAMQEQIAAAQRWDIYDTELANYDSAVAALDEEIELLLAAEPLDDAIGRVTAEQSSITDRHAEHLATQRLHHDLAAQLRDADAVCPVCRQSIDAGQAAVAEAYHRDAVSDASRQELVLAAALDDVRHQVAELRTLNQRRSQLVSPQPPAGLRPDNDASLEDNEVAARERHQDLQQQLSDARARVQMLQAQLDDADRAADTGRRVVQSRRMEAAAVAAVDVMNRAIRHHIAERIDPLSDAIAQSWGQFFTTDGTIELNDQGEIELIRGDGRRLGYSQLSGGQQMLAMLTMRLTLVAGTTRLGCVWLDEPLEHLDPTNRRRAANLLVHAAQQPGINQVLATTYEEETARRLAATDPTAKLKYVRAD